MTNIPRKGEFVPLFRAGVLFYHQTVPLVSTYCLLRNDVGLAREGKTLFVNFKHFLFFFKIFLKKVLTNAKVCTIIYLIG